MKKNWTIIITAVLVSLFVMGCSTSSSQEDQVPHYRFSSADLAQIIQYPYTPGQQLTYSNANGETLHFRVLSNTTKKRGTYSQGTFSGGGGILQSYYDSKVIRLEIIENQAASPYEQVIYIFSKSENQFKNGIRFPIWNFENYSFVDEIDQPFNINLIPYNYSTPTTISINGRSFSTVAINSQNTSPLLNSGGGALPNSIRKVDYDFSFGIVQFEDINGVLWKVNYPN